MGRCHIINTKPKQKSLLRSVRANFCLLWLIGWLNFAELITHLDLFPLGSIRFQRLPVTQHHLDEHAPPAHSFCRSIVGDHNSCRQHGGNASHAWRMTHTKKMWSHRTGSKSHQGVRDSPGSVFCGERHTAPAKPYHLYADLLKTSPPRRLHCMSLLPARRSPIGPLLETSNLQQAQLNIKITRRMGTQWRTCSQNYVLR